MISFTPLSHVGFFSPCYRVKITVRIIEKCETNIDGKIGLLSSKYKRVQQKHIFSAFILHDNRAKANIFLQSVSCSLCRNNKIEQNELIVRVVRRSLFKFYRKTMKKRIPVNGIITDDVGLLPLTISWS